MFPSSLRVFARTASSDVDPLSWTVNLWGEEESTMRKTGRRYSGCAVEGVKELVCCKAGTCGVGRWGRWRLRGLPVRNACGFPLNVRPPRRKAAPCGAGKRPSRSSIDPPGSPKSAVTQFFASSRGRECDFGLKFTGRLKVTLEKRMTGQAHEEESECETRRYGFVPLWLWHASALR